MTLSTGSNAAVDDLLAVPHIAAHLPKLLTHPADQHHLFVITEPGSIPGSLWIALMAEVTALPATPPRLPDRLTHLMGHDRTRTPPARHPRRRVDHPPRVRAVPGTVDTRPTATAHLGAHPGTATAGASHTAWGLRTLTPAPPGSVRPAAVRRRTPLRLCGALGPIVRQRRSARGARWCAGGHPTEPELIDAATLVRRLLSTPGSWVGSKRAEGSAQRRHQEPGHASGRGLVSVA